MLSIEQTSLQASQVIGMEHKGTLVTAGPIVFLGGMVPLCAFVPFEFLGETGSGACGPGCVCCTIQGLS